MSAIKGTDWFLERTSLSISARKGTFHRDELLALGFKDWVFSSQTLETAASCSSGLAGIAEGVEVAADEADDAAEEEDVAAAGVGFVAEAATDEAGTGWSLGADSLVSWSSLCFPEMPCLI